MITSWIVVGFGLSQIPTKDLKRLRKKIVRGDRILMTGAITTEESGTYYG